VIRSGMALGRALFLLGGVLAPVAGVVQAQPPAHDRPIGSLKEVNARARALLKLDSEARNRFEREYPGLLPETKLVLPSAEAEAFDWCNLNKVSEAHRQMSQDCWANAATEALECSHLIRNNHRAVLSVQPILDQLKLGSNHIEGRSSMACDFFLKHGTTRADQYPYTGKPAQPRAMPLPYRAVAWGYVSQDGSVASVEQFKETLLRHGPLPLSLVTTRRFHDYRGGLFDEGDPPAHERIKTNHAVLLVGWDDTRGRRGAWKIKNSWGTGWGEQGFMWIAYGSNHIGAHAVWLQAVSSYYPIPAEFYTLLPDARPLPHVRAIGKKS
jgi:cathepsin L